MYMKTKLTQYKVHSDGGNKSNIKGSSNAVTSNSLLMKKKMG